VAAESLVEGSRFIGIGIDTDELIWMYEYDYMIVRLAKSSLGGFERRFGLNSHMEHPHAYE
jgi:hypothetical protein